MTIAPRYEIPAGSAVTISGRQLIVREVSVRGYAVTNVQNGTGYSVSFERMAAELRLPGAKLDTLIVLTGNRLQDRLGGYRSANSLPSAQRTVAQFHLALCVAMNAVRDATRISTKNPDFEFSADILNQAQYRQRIKDIAERLFQQKIHLNIQRGGKSTQWALYRGRTLIKYLKIFDKCSPGEDPVDALVPLDHKKGNRTPRISYVMLQLMTKAWTEIGLDAKKPPFNRVFERLEVLVDAENKKRAKNELPALVLPSVTTLADHRKKILTPTEFSIARNGEKETKNVMGRGSTDIPALFIGEEVEVDECKASLVVSAKVRGNWEHLNSEDRAVLEEIDKEIRKRLHILVMIDVATRMPLAWVISDQPKAEALLALFRMATRDKDREKGVYGCTGQPAFATGLGRIVSDNGPGLKNAETIEAGIGIGASRIFVRSYSPTDKEYVERMFGTIESVLLSLIHGYTGRRPGHLPAYDANANGVIDVDLLYEILTKFMIDEYPSMLHHGVGMWAGQPAEVYQKINETRGHVALIDPDIRRIQLCWEEQVTPNDEGVRVFSGIWYNSDELQLARETWSDIGKVSVYVDPDDLNAATVLVPGVTEPITVRLQLTAFADLTLPQALELMAEYRKQDPRTAEVHYDRLMRVRSERYELMKQLSVEHRLPRSFSTIEECQNKARTVFAGARIVGNRQMLGTMPAGRLLSKDAPGTIYKLGSGDNVVEGVAQEVKEPSVSEPTMEEDVAQRADTPQDRTSVSPEEIRKPRAKVKKLKEKPATPVLGRPVNGRRLE